MIFVTVGTHEQQFNRLLEKIDILKEQGVITEEVIAQIGYSDYQPRTFKYEKLLSFIEMNNYAAEADLIITHGGPASIFLAYSHNKIPVVVPRQKKYDEHIDNHQLIFAKRLANENKIILVEEIDELKSLLSNKDNLHDKYKSKGESNKVAFVERFEKEISSLIKS
ncbi:glycosyltransferase [Bacillus sp. Au-Bac7]|uniref:glycosyltransferase n=1 Tax=Bacillus sp. Au-Bac7 TaxID=2906458 RepID=UPI001E65A895|nr:glycosyltransferase [Bacillus sp. Au-Bac7]MCE4049559.1 multidrug MFS transporter [Bacillus sp. Au-Bac7]